MKKTAAKAKAPADTSAGFCVYIGPAILGAIGRNTIIPGTKEEVLATPAVVHALSIEPEIKSLIVDGSVLAQSRIKASTPGTYLYRQYQKIANPKKED